MDTMKNEAKLGGDIYLLSLQSFDKGKKEVHFSIKYDKKKKVWVGEGTFDKMDKNVQACLQAIVDKANEGLRKAVSEELSLETEDAKEEHKTATKIDPNSNWLVDMHNEE